MPAAGLRPSAVLALLPLGPFVAAQPTYKLVVPSHLSPAAVLKLEGACVLLISQLKHAATAKPLPAEEAQLKSRIMQRILVNDAEIRMLAEPWLEDLDGILAGKPKTVH